MSRLKEILSWIAVISFALVYINLAVILLTLFPYSITLFSIIFFTSIGTYLLIDAKESSK